jgi:hypothetical protein
MLAPSLTRGRVCRLSESLSVVISQLSECTLYLYFTCYYMLLNVCVCYTRSLPVQVQYSRSCPIFSSSNHNGSLVTWTVVCLTAAKFKPFIFLTSDFALFSAPNVCIFMISYDFCLLSAKFCYVVIYVRKFESHVQIPNQCAHWEIANGAENFVLQGWNFNRCLSATNSQSGQA